MLEFIVHSAFLFLGNVLINVGPAANGIIIPVFRLRLKQLGEWLTVNGEAIYNTTPCFSQNDVKNSDVWYTCNTLDVTKTSANNITVGFTIFFNWPEDNILRIRNIVNHLESFNVRILLLKSAGDVTVQVSLSKIHTIYQNKTGRRYQSSRLTELL